MATKTINIDTIIAAETKVSNTSGIFRFKFSDDFVDELSQFAKIHQFDDRHQFKDAWNTWVEDNNDIVTAELRRLANMGYNGDGLDKMFKSARYYFRKKSAEKKAPVERRAYVNVDKELLDAMDEHIMENIDNDSYTPKDGFTDFCKSNLELLKKVVNQICESGLRDARAIEDKVKKTYKNRYFVLIKK
jgi:hypothetical protein